MTETEWRHPEMRSSEVLIGNFDEDNYRICDWKTRRTGWRAYDASGKPIDNETLFPVFVQRTEVEARGITIDGQFNMTLPRA